MIPAVHQLPRCTQQQPAPRTPLYTAYHERERGTRRETASQRTGSRRAAGSRFRFYRIRPLHTCVLTACVSRCACEMCALCGVSLSRGAPWPWTRSSAEPTLISAARRRETIRVTLFPSICARPYPVHLPVPPLISLYVILPSQVPGGEPVVGFKAYNQIPSKNHSSQLTPQSTGKRGGVTARSALRLRYSIGQFGVPY